MRVDALDWVTNFPGAVTVCDRQGVILFLNEKAQAKLAKEGGAALVGKNLLDCHPEPARRKLEELLANPRVNVYTIEKNSQKKLIYQAPWTQSGVVAGLVELSLELPNPLPHFVRKG